MVYLWDLERIDVIKSVNLISRARQMLSGLHHSLQLVYCILYVYVELCCYITVNMVGTLYAGNFLRGNLCMYVDVCACAHPCFSPLRP